MTAGGGDVIEPDQRPGDHDSRLGPYPGAEVGQPRKQRDGTFDVATCGGGIPTLGLDESGNGRHQGLSRLVSQRVEAEPLDRLHAESPGLDQVVLVERQQGQLGKGDCVDPGSHDDATTSRILERHPGERRLPR